jgi:Ecdysteroid kinase-like family
VSNVTRIEDITSEWLHDVIGTPSDAVVTSETVGTGQVARCFRLRITSELESRSFVAKGPSLDDASIGAASMQKLYLRETSFYRFLAPRIATRTPECFFVERDDEDNFLILLEDMAPSDSADQFEGISFDMAKAGLVELAGLHSATMNDAELHQSQWLNGVSQSLAPLMGQVLPILFQQFSERYSQDVEPAVLSFVERLSANLEAFRSFRSYAPCVTHGDFRTDNLLFNARGGEVPLCVVDWQTVAVSSPFLDVAYFLTTSLTTPDRERLEGELLDFYLGEMRQRGADIPEAVAKKEFARFTLQPIVMLVCASVLVERTERGDRMFLTMIRRGIAAAQHWNALEELENDAPSP